MLPSQFTSKLNSTIKGKVLLYIYSTITHYFEEAILWNLYSSACHIPFLLKTGITSPLPHPLASRPRVSLCLSSVVNCLMYSVSFSLSPKLKVMRIPLRLTVLLLKHFGWLLLDKLLEVKSWDPQVDKGFTSLQHAFFCLTIPWR